MSEGIKRTSVTAEEAIREESLSGEAVNYNTGRHTSTFKDIPST